MWNLMIAFGLGSALSVFIFLWGFNVGRRAAWEEKKDLPPSKRFTFTDDPEGQMQVEQRYKKQKLSEG